jgi:Mg2+ and Co2+ transporter CorA
MGDVIEGIGPAQRERIASLRKAGRFFWIDVPLGEKTRDGLGEALGIPGHALHPLVDFREDTPPSRKFHSDGEHVVFSFSCFLEPAEIDEAVPEPLHAIEIHILICGDYILTVHDEQLSLPDLLDPAVPDGRSEQYLVYAILDAMVATGFDALNEAELTLEGM